MQTRRLTSVHDVVILYDFFLEGLKCLQRKALFEMSEELFFKKLLFYVEKETSWVGVVEDDVGVPLGFCVFLEATQIFDENRSFVCWVFYHISGYANATRLLLEAFENFCKQNEIKQIIVSTKRDSGAATRCFKKYGFEPGYLVFLKGV